MVAEEGLVVRRPQLALPGVVAALLPRQSCRAAHCRVRGVGRLHGRLMFVGQLLILRLDIVLFRGFLGR